MDEEMRFINFIKPPLQTGKYKIHAAQSVTAPESNTFRQETAFSISGRAYTVSKEDVFSHFPADNESGEFADTLPFIVMENRTYPWERTICADTKKGMPVPWVALIVVSAGEGAEEQDMLISDLLDKQKQKQNICFPFVKPSVAVEKESQTCHIVDLPVTLWREIIPSLEDLPYLCHSRSVNLRKTEDSVCARNGFFSVICANRFVPSGMVESVKSTVHLVSLLGYADPQIKPEHEKIRFVSLYHWDIYSKKKSEENFASVIERLKGNCGAMNYNMRTDLQKLGYCVKKHITRTGEQTYSLYHPPLIPFLNQETMATGDKYTADGRLIYDKSTGILDVTYAAAWQLGRLMTVNNPAVAAEIIRHKKTRKVKRHHRLLAANIDFTELNVKNLLVQLVENNILSGGQGK